MKLTIEQIAQRVKLTIAAATERETRHENVLAVRQGNISKVYPDFFPDGVDANVVANFIDVAARDFSEVMAPLPAVNCSAANAVNDRARAFADKRTRIAANYMHHSDLSVHQFKAADYYNTFGFTAYIVELDEEAKLPRIRVENSMGSYPEFDRYGRCVAFSKRYSSTLGELIVKFPEFEDELLAGKGYNQSLSSEVEIIRYYDKYQSVIFVPTLRNLVLSQADNPIGKMLVEVAVRPSIDDDLRGQFDDVLGIQLMRNRFALLAMEAAEKGVQAPLIVPRDVQDMEFGPDAIIRTENPSGVRRVELPIPQGAFQEQSLLNQELRVGSRYPEGRTGNVNASIVTGQGVQALMGAFDTQVKSAQTIFAVALRNVLRLCFEVDEKMYSVEKTIRGVDAGSPYEIVYNPVKDIKGDYTVEVRYGMLAGLNPAQGLIFMLQALGGGLISADMAMRELPFSVNVTQEMEKIEIETMRKGLLSNIQNFAQIAASGQDPTQMILSMAEAIKARQGGKTIEDAMLDAFKPKEQPQVPSAGANATQVEQPSPAPTAAPAEGASAQPMPQPQSPQAQMQMARQRPDIQSLLSNLSASGAGNMSARTINRR